MKLIGSYKRSKAWFFPTTRLIRRLTKMGFRAEPRYQEIIHNRLPPITSEWVVYRKGQKSARIRKLSTFSTPYFMQTREDAKIEDLKTTAEPYAHVISTESWDYKL